MPANVLLFSPDEAGLAELTGNLKEAGFAPLLLIDARHCLQVARARRPELAILRTGSRPADAFALLQQLKLDPQTSLIPGILLAPARSSPPTSPGWHIAPDRCLMEPVRAQELLDALCSERRRAETLVQEGILSQVLLELRSEIRCLGGLSELLMALLSHTNLTQAQAHHLLTAVREIATNCIEWGHACQAERVVEMSYTLRADRVTLVLRDSGPGFDPAKLPHAARPGDPMGHLGVRSALGLREGGFGIMITRGLVDELRYNERGNEAVLVKCFSPPLRQEAS